MSVCCFFRHEMCLFAAGYVCHVPWAPATEANTNPGTQGGLRNVDSLRQCLILPLTPPPRPGPSGHPVCVSVCAAGLSVGCSDRPTRCRSFHFPLASSVDIRRLRTGTEFDPHSSACWSAWNGVRRFDGMGCGVGAVVPVPLAGWSLLGVGPGDRAPAACLTHVESAAPRPAAVVLLVHWWLCT